MRKTFGKVKFKLLISSLPDNETNRQRSYLKINSLYYDDNISGFRNEFNIGFR